MKPLYNYFEGMFDADDSLDDFGKESLIDDAKKLETEYNIGYNYWDGDGKIEFKGKTAIIHNSIYPNSNDGGDKGLEKFVKDFDLNKIINDNEMSFRNKFNFKDVEFEAKRRIEFETLGRVREQEFKNCKFKSDLIRFSYLNTIKFSNVDMKCSAVDIDERYLCLDCKNTKIETDEITLATWTYNDKDEFIDMLERAGIELKIVKSKAVIEVVDSSKVDTIFTANGDHVWKGLKRLNFRVSLDFDELRRYKYKKLIFSIVKKGSSYVLDSFEEHRQ